MCLVLLHGQNNFCLGQNKFVPDKNFCTRLKSSDQPFCMTKEFCTQLKSRFLIEKSHFRGLFKRKNGLFSNGQNFCPGQKLFCLGQFRFCPRQKIFCPCRRTRHFLSRTKILSMAKKSVFPHEKSLKMTFLN